jgi:hypothetical protein
MTKKQFEDFIQMHATLRRIAHGYMTPAQIRRDAGRDCSALDYAEYLEMSYENIQQEAKNALKGVRLPKQEVAV